MDGPRATTVLFVHGAHLAGWCWLLVMDQLARLGIESHAIDLPLTGYADDVESVRAAIGAARSRWGPVHVVCHSYAGLPVAEAGHAAAHLTFVAGRLPLAVVCADDRAVRPEAQRERAALVGASIELDTDHSPFFSGPAALAGFIAGRHRAMACP